MRRKYMGLLSGLVLLGCGGAGGCVVAPPRARVAVVAPAAVWVPAHWSRSGVWVAGHWRGR